MPDDTEKAGHRRRTQNRDQRGQPMVEPITAGQKRRDIGGNPNESRLAKGGQTGCAGEEHEAERNKSGDADDVQ